MQPNRLSKEKSPYLLQHASNPVDWHPWGAEAFENARKEEKPLFISIGYSTCHWCHVMAHESFEDDEVAALLNRSFVCVKVDREERPDIDGVYMAVCQMMSGSCGWPLTVVTTPDGTPFFAATYIPKRGRFGQPGLMELIPEINGLWRDRRDEVNGLAEGIRTALKRRPEARSDHEPGLGTLGTAADQLAAKFDEVNGGFGTAPKFPSPHNLLFLLRAWKRTGNKRLLEMVERTLVAMRKGGIWDHVGFGFHRYSVDEEWFVPHFEKMLCDQAMLALAYTEAYQATRNGDYAATARHALDYVLRDMRSDEGGFCSAEDADSEGEEGKFYLWSESELRRVLGEEDASLAVKAFGVTRQGNYTDSLTSKLVGRNILHLKASAVDMAPVLRTDWVVLAERLETVRKKLFESRQKRVRPHRDDKVLTDWNGLMVAALARAAQVLGEDAYGKAAEKAAGFLLDRMRTQGRLLHRYLDGDASIAGNLDDYAFLVWGLLELYEYSFNPAHLKAAQELNGAMLEHFWDAEHGGLYFSPDDGEKLLVRRKEIDDGALPSGNSAAALNLLRLSRMTGDAKLEERCRVLMKAFSAEVDSFPAAHSHLMLALEFALGLTHEVVIVGDRGVADTEAMLGALRANYLPGKVVLLKPAGEDGGGLASLAPFTKDMKMVDGKATAYICTGGACKRPVTDAWEMLEQMK